MKVRIAAVSLALLAVGCIENDEEVEVARDGSVAVTVTAEGDRADFEAGFPLPQGRAWRWIEGEASESAAPAEGERIAVVSDNDKVRRSMSARFDSAAAMPSFFAPEAEAYRTAYVERRSELRIERKGARTVYTFERTYPARVWKERSALQQLGELVPEDVQKALEESLPLTEAQWSVLTPIVVGEYQRSARSFARDALVSIYTTGDADLPARVVSATLETIDARVAAALSLERLQRIYAALIDPNADGDAIAKDETLNPDLVVRALLRSTLAESLANAAVAESTRFAAAERLEWSFTALDATADLQDEKFELGVTMPGIVIDGNFAALDGSRAEWEFEGKALNDQPLHLRVVSVVE